MPLYPWRRFRPTPSHAACVSGSEEGVNYTSHHLRCTQVETLSSHRSTCQQGSCSKDRVARSWPGTAPAYSDDDDDTYSTIFTPQHELQYTETSRKNLALSKEASNISIISRTSIAPPLIRKPPLCRLPASMRLSSLILYTIIGLSLLTTTTIAAPSVQRSNNHAQIHRRQAIPDRTGNTGNRPAAVKPDVPPRPFTVSSEPTVTPASTSNVNIPTPSSSSSSSSSSIPSSISTPAPAPPTPQPTNPVPGSSGNTNAPDSLGLDPNGRETPFPVASPTMVLSAGTIAGIAGGGVALLCLFIFVGVWLYRRRRIDVNEIAIRRSKLGSRLAMRVFGGNPGSRSASRAGSIGSEGSGPFPYDEKRYESSVDKASISKPKSAWLENGLLSVPKPGFLKDKERNSADDAAPWVDKGTISGPRPGRPRSAEPLGRLSGMGMGMGYLK